MNGMGQPAVLVATNCEVRKRRVRVQRLQQRNRTAPVHAALPDAEAGKTRQPLERTRQHVHACAYTDHVCSTRGRKGGGEPGG